MSGYLPPFQPPFSAVQDAAMRAVLAAYPLPDSYLVLDVETSGLSSKDVIVDLGYVLVMGGEIQESANFVIDWSRDLPFLQENGITDLPARIAATKSAMEARGNPYPYDWDLLKCGWAPTPAFRAVRSLIHEAQAAGIAMAGHNFEFDRLRIHATVATLCDDVLPWNMDNIVDTGLIHKAISIPMLPYPQEPSGSWFHRVRGARAKDVLWNLSGHCVPFYSLASRYNLAEGEFHGDSRYDCMAVHYLIDTWRRWADLPPSAPVPRQYRIHRPLDLAGL